MAWQRQRAVPQFQFLLESLVPAAAAAAASAQARSRGGVSGGIGTGGMKPSGRRLALRARRCRQQINHAVAVIGREGVDVDQSDDTRPRAVGNAGRDHAAIGMADEIDAGQIFKFKHAEDVGNMRVEIDIGMSQMAALAEPGVASA